MLHIFMCNRKCHVIKMKRIQFFKIILLIQTEDIYTKKIGLYYE